jgi:hypothetical protein
MGEGQPRVGFSCAVASLEVILGCSSGYRAAIVMGQAGEAFTTLRHAMIAESDTFNVGAKALRNSR